MNGFHLSTIRFSLLTRAAAGLGMLLLSACHVYVPVDSPLPAPGEEIRVLIDAEAVRRIRAETGRPIDELEGRFVEAGQDSLRVSVVMAREPWASSTNELRRIFSVASSEVVQIQRSQFSGKRTALLGAGIAALLALVVVQMDVGDGGAGDTPESPEPSPVVVPGFRVPMPR